MMGSVSHVDSHVAHQLERITALHHPRPQAVIEVQLAGDDFICEMHIGDSGSQIASNLRQFQIVSRHKPQCVGRQQSPNDGFGTDHSVMRIRAGEYFVQQE